MGLFHQEDLTLLNTYATNEESEKFLMKLTDLKRYIDSSTILLGNFNTPFHNQTDQPDIFKRKQITVLNDKLEELGSLIGIGLYTLQN